MEKNNYLELEVDTYPSKDSIDVIQKFLESLKLSAESMNSEVTVNNLRKFNWRISIQAKGEWH